VRLPLQEHLPVHLMPQPRLQPYLPVHQSLHFLQQERFPVQAYLQKAVLQRRLPAHLMLQPMLRPYLPVHLS